MDFLFDGVKELFGYNRENFMFDQEQRLKREFQEQDMRVKQFCLYREDVRDLTELTTSKMDIYMVVVLLELGCCLNLLVHGVLKPDFAEATPEYPSAPLWLSWLYVVSLAETFLYLFLSAWLAIHASVAAHSFTVRLLTQYVRLPVPSRAQLDAARAYAEEFESQGIQKLLRVPVWEQQVEHMKSALADKDDQEPEGGGAVAAAGAIAAMSDPVNPTLALKHVQVYRQLQSNWQAHDAYARACLSLGTYKLLHTVSYYTIGFFVVELRAPWPAFGCVVLLQTLSCLLVSFDLFFGHCVFLLGAVFVMSGPFLAVVATTLLLTEEHRVPAWLRDAHYVLVPLIFIFGAVKTLMVAAVTNTEQTGGARVPTRFRAVLYLDVFGWLNSPDGRGDAGQPTANAEDTEVAAEQRELDGSVPVAPQPQEEGAAASASQERSVCPLPACAGVALRQECQQLRLEVEEEFAAWSGSGMTRNLRSMRDLQAEIQQSRRRFDASIAELDRLPCSQPSSSSSSAMMEPTRAAGVTWVKVVREGVQYFINPATGESVGQEPQGARLSDMQGLQAKLSMLEDRVSKLRTVLLPCAPNSATAPNSMSARSASSGAPPQSVASGAPPQAAAAGESPQAAAAAAGSRRVRWRPSERSSVSSDFSSAFRTSLLQNADGTAPPGDRSQEETGAQETRFGGREAIDMDQAPSREAWAHSQAAPTTFYPRQDGRRESRRVPGEVPWSTFFWGNVMVVFVNLYASVYFGIVVPIDALVFNKRDLDRPWLLEHALPPLDEPKLIMGDLATSWHGPVHAVGLTCHDALGPKALVAESYGIRAVSLDEGEVNVGIHSLPSLDECFSRAPGFHAGGIAGVSLECGEGGHCAAVVLGRSGTAALVCPLAESPVPTVVRLPDLQHGQGWSLLAVPPQRGNHSRRRQWWGLPAAVDEAARNLTELRVQVPGKGLSRAVAHQCPLCHTATNAARRETAASLRAAAMHTAQAAEAAASFAGVQSLHASSAKPFRLLGLSQEWPALTAWRRQRPSGDFQALGSWSLPRGKAWTGVCAYKGHIYALARAAGGAAPELWRFREPARMSDVSQF